MSRRDMIYRNLDIIENILWDVVFQVKMVKDKNYRDTMYHNKIFNNKYKGEACFILGNGPSLKEEQNLEFLKNHYVFTVNQLYRSEIFNIVQPNFHLMVDPLFFSLRENEPSENDTLQRIKNLSSYENLTLILPYTSKQFIENNHIGNKTNIYIESRYRSYDGFKRKIRMDKYMPQVQTVVHAAIYCAIYMGFSKIYLLGCDMTGILENYVKSTKDQDNEKFIHVYGYNEQEKERIRKVHQMNDNEIMLKSYATMFSVFRNIHDYCDRNGIQIYNITQGGALDNLPKLSLDEVLSELGEDIK